MTARARPDSSVRQAGVCRAQSLVELALVTPLLLGIVAVLFQFGILFVAYLSIVHEMRDIGRFAAVHPDTMDGSSCTQVGTLWNQVCADAPSVIDAGHITDVSFTPACPVLIAAKCPARLASSQLQISITYDASSVIFLPARFKLGPWLDVGMPTSLPTYDYFVMVEPH